MDIKTQTYKLIDDLKAVCHNYGMGNDGNEYKVITQIFLYKFLNDKFGYEIKQKDERIAKAEKWETAYSEMSEDDRLDLLDSLSPDVPRLYPQHLISFLWNQQAKGDFSLIFDNTMVDISQEPWLTNSSTSLLKMHLRKATTSSLAYLSMSSRITIPMVAAYMPNITHLTQSPLSWHDCLSVTGEICITLSVTILRREPVLC